MIAEMKKGQDAEGLATCHGWSKVDWCIRSTLQFQESNLGIALPFVGGWHSWVGLAVHAVIRLSKPWVPLGR